MGSPWKETWDKEVCVGGLFGSWCQGMNNIAKDQSMVYYWVGHIVGSRAQFHQDTLKNVRKASKNYPSEHWPFLNCGLSTLVEAYLECACARASLFSTSVLLLVHAFKLDYTSASPHTPPAGSVGEAHKTKKVQCALGPKCFQAPNGSKLQWNQRCGQEGMRQAHRVSYSAYVTNYPV